MATRIMNRNDIMQVIEMGPPIQAVENVYTMKSRGEAVAWPTVFHVFEEGQRDMDIRSGYLPGEHIFGHKTIGFFAGNTEKGLPNLMATINVFDEFTGAPVGILEGAYITGVRTGAAGARVFVDDMAHCIEAGEVEIPVKKGIIAEEEIHEIGDLILGNCAGRTSDEDITIYDPAGMALLDIAAANVALRLAEEKNLGTVVEL